MNLNASDTFTQEATSIYRKVIKGQFTQTFPHSPLVASISADSSGSFYNGEKFVLQKLFKKKKKSFQKRCSGFSGSEVFVSTSAGFQHECIEENILRF